MLSGAKPCCLVPSGVVGAVWRCLRLPGAVQSSLVLSGAVKCCLVLSNTVCCVLALSDAVWRCLVLSSALWCCLVVSVLYGAVSSCLVMSGASSVVPERLRKCLWVHPPAANMAPYLSHSQNSSRVLDRKSVV